MKKLLVLVAIFTTVVMSANAQGGGQGMDPVAAKAKYVERTKPQLIEKTKITDAQADKVIDISWDYNIKRRGLRDLSEDDRKKQMDEMKTAQDKAFKDIPLTDDQVKAVNEFFDEMRKQMQQQRQQNGGGVRNGGN
jgi:hypothetical protein